MSVDWNRNHDPEGSEGGENEGEPYGCLILSSIRVDKTHAGSHDYEIGRIGNSGTRAVEITKSGCPIKTFITPPLPPPHSFVPLLLLTASSIHTNTLFAHTGFLLLFCSSAAPVHRFQDNIIRPSARTYVPPAYFHPTLKRPPHHKYKTQPKTSLSRQPTWLPI